MIYYWEKGFIEHKEEENPPSLNITILRKDDLQKSGQGLTKPLKGKLAFETRSTVKTCGDSFYRKSDIAEAKFSLQRKLAQGSSQSRSAEPRKKLQKISAPKKLEESDSDEELQ